MSTLDDRRRGALIGLAVGDALGAAVEFKAPGTFEPVNDYRGGGPHPIGPGEWTDDTSMALALADSIGQNGWDLDNQARRYLAWFKTGEYSVNGRCFDIGNTTLAALLRFEKDRDARRSGSDSLHASGNGSIMRLAPVPIAYADAYPDRLALLVDRLIESSLPTHASPECLSACVYLGVVLAALMNGEPREAVLAPDWSGLTRLRTQTTLAPEVASVVAGRYRGKRRSEVIGSGYVVLSLEAALWAFHDAPDFRTAVLKAVNLGDDADTTGAVCGQLAGAFWGESGIPPEWRQKLARRDLIDPILRKLLDC